LTEKGIGVGKIYNFCAYFKLHVYAQFLFCTATSNEHVSIATTANTSVNNKLLSIQEKQQTICSGYYIKCSSHKNGQVLGISAST
jgi:DNA-directed RNA polymerase specialized sigma subunit